MKIALTADPELPVPPKFYGGIERIIDLLAGGLVARGHEVTLFAHPDSSTAGHLVPWPGRTSSSLVDTARNAATLARHLFREKYDIIHSFSRIASLTPVLPHPVPKLMTYQRAITRRTVRTGLTLSRGTLAFSAISDWMMESVDDLGRWFMIPNGVPSDVYNFVSAVPDDAPLVFLGRIEEIKGPHLAIELAKRSGNKLILAGNVPEGGEAWFESNVAAYIDDTQIRYIGPVDDQQKNDLLGGAKAFLMPILWDEPFGIVMAEALACGTPVLGLGRGAVPEVVENGVSGFVAETLDELLLELNHLNEIDRVNCRKRMEAKYSADVVVEAYERVYEMLVHSSSAAVE